MLSPGSARQSIPKYRVLTLLLRLTPEPENQTLFNRGPEDMAAA